VVRACRRQRGRSRSPPCRRPLAVVRGGPAPPVLQLEGRALRNVIGRAVRGKDPDPIAIFLRLSRRV